MPPKQNHTQLYTKYIPILAKLGLVRTQTFPKLGQMTWNEPFYHSHTEKKASFITKSKPNLNPITQREDTEVEASRNFIIKSKSLSNINLHKGIDILRTGVFLLLYLKMYHFSSTFPFFSAENPTISVDFEDVSGMKMTGGAKQTKGYVSTPSITVHGNHGVLTGNSLLC